MRGVTRDAVDHAFVLDQSGRLGPTGQQPGQAEQVDRGEQVLAAGPGLAGRRDQLVDTGHCQHPVAVTMAGSVRAEIVEAGRHRAGHLRSLSTTARVPSFHTLTPGAVSCTPSGRRVPPVGQRGVMLTAADLSLRLPALSSARTW